VSEARWAGFGERTVDCGTDRRDRLHLPFGHVPDEAMIPDTESTAAAVPPSDRLVFPGVSALGRRSGCLRNQPVTCILNGAAGSRQALQAKNQLPDLFRRHGAEARIVLARDGGEIRELARRAVEDRSAVVVAGGGDGTMNAVAGALIGSTTAMGILPLGTLNHFAKDLKIPLNIEAAVATIVTGQLTQIDAGEVNGRIFLNNSSIGIYPGIVRERQKEEHKGYGKWGAFGWAVISVLHRYSLLHVHLRVDDQNEPGVKTPFVFIGNNKYESTGLSIGHRKALDEGQLLCRGQCQPPPDYLMPLPFCAPANDATRGPCFSSRSAGSRLMMG
jgi:diacylglycerol kinase family enzyme